MKHIQKINEWFGIKEEGDEYAKTLLDIIKKERKEIKIEASEYGLHLYDVIIDENKYVFDPYSLCIYGDNLELLSKIEISSKYYKSIKELFNKQEKEKNGDKIAKNLLNTIEKNKIEIKEKEDKFSYPITYYYKVIVDNIKYTFNATSSKDLKDNYSYFYLKIYDSNTSNKIKISPIYFYNIQELYEKQKKRKKLEKLPDISPIGRDVKKYNL